MNEARLKEGEVLAILHIPKTAGTSLISAIGRSGIRYAHILDPRFHDELRMRCLTSGDHLISLAPAISAGHYAVVVGHMTRSDVIRALGRTTTIRYAAFIRNPIDRIISEYYYYISERHPDHAFMRERYPSLDCYARESGDTNLMCHYLEAYRGQPLRELADDVIANFSFLGRSDTYDRDASRLFRLFADVEPAPARLNVGDDRPAPSRSVLATIRRRNRKDIQLFSRLSRAFGWTV